MYLADYHTHTRCSPDSSAPLPEMVQAARSAGLSELCTTDHFDLLDVDGRPVRTLDWAPILEQYRRAVPPDLTLRLGLELGGAQVDPACAAAVLEGAELDFVIGSVHNLSPQRGGRDFYFLDYDTPETCTQTLDDYFESLAALAHLDCFDVMGHIIYPLRYMQRIPGHPVTLSGYQDRLKELLTTLADRGKGIEVNTWCGRTVDQWRPVLALYRACGGELVTLGSDAHTPEHVGLGLTQAHALLKETGFRYQTIFDHRTPQFIRL